MTLTIGVSLPNINESIDAGDIADTIEKIISQYTGLECKTSIYDSDGSKMLNPVLAYNTMQRVAR